MRARRFRPHALQVAAVLLCLVLVTSHFSMGVYARYTASDNSGDSARVAAFVFNVTPSSHVFDLSGIQKPGDQQNFAFTINNGGGASEVAERYQVDLQLNGSMPLTCTINSTSKSRNTEGLNTEPQTFSSVGTGSFSAAVSGSEAYTLSVVWPETANDLKYASDSAVGSVVVTVLGVQID